MHKVSTILLLTILFLCCGPSEGTDEDASHIFRYNQASGITSLDPVFSKDQANIWAVNQLYNGLVQLDNDLNIIPCIAREWEISEDGLEYRFVLRDDVYFHENSCFPDNRGRRVVAADFVFSFERILDPKVASPGSWIFAGNIREERPFDAESDTVFVIHLKRPFRPFLSILTMQYCSVVPREAVTVFGENFRSNPVGTGPFYFRSWEEGVSMTFLKNKNYFEKTGDERLPYLDGVHISFIENPRTTYLKFLSGELDFISGIDESYKNDVLNKNGELHPDLSGKVVLYKKPFLNVEYLGFLIDNNNNNTKHPLQNKYVRQAINYGFDREKLINYLRNNIGIPATSGFIPPGLPSFDPDEVKGYTYDVKKAKLLLERAGYPNGEGMGSIKLMTNSSYENIGVFITNQLEDIGLQIELELLPPAFLRELMAKGSANFFRGSWIADYPDAESYFVVLYGKNDAPPNYTRFNNEKFNELYEKAVSTKDNEERYKIYREMDRIIIEEAPLVPLYYDEVLRFVRKGVKGLEPNPLNLLILKEVDFN